MTTTMNINNMNTWEEITKAMYIAQSLRSKIEKSKADLITARDKYGATREITAAINELDKQISEQSERIDACELRLSAIGHKLSTWEENYALARDCHFSRNYTRNFHGDEKKDHDKTIANVAEILGKLVERVLATPDNERWTESNGDYLELLTKGEYKRLKNAISHFGHALYAENYKIKADSVAFLIFAAIKADNKSGGIKVCGEKVIRDALINIVNLKMFPPEKSEPEKKTAKKTATEPKKSEITK